MRGWYAGAINEAYVGVGNEPTPSYAATVLGIGTVPCEGSEWQISIWDVGTDSLVEDLTPDYNLGWYDGYGYYIGSFSFDALEGNEVVMRIWNAVDKSDATCFLDSQPLTLPDLGLDPPPQANNVQFDFTGSLWAVTLLSPGLIVNTEHGTASNVYNGADGTWTCSINSPVAESGTNYMCTGWIITVLGGSETNSSGTSTNTGPFYLFYAGDTTVTWLWESYQYWLDTSIIGNGSLNMLDGWQPAGSNIALVATPADGWFFAGWSDDLTGNHAQTNTSLLMDGTKSITATFTDNPDQDDDGIDDAWEQTFFGFNGNCNPTNDADHDLYTNLEEFEHNTNPNTFDIYLMYAQNQLATDFSWKAVSGVTYQVQMSTNLPSGSWSDVGEPVEGVGQIHPFSESTQAADHKAYRVQTQNPPSP